MRLLAVTAKLVLPLLALSVLSCSSISKEKAADAPVAEKLNSHITVLGFVYCDVCSNNSFSRHSYFIPGVEVKIDCIFNALSSSTAEKISFSVKRFTNMFGYYQLEVPSVDGIQCADESAVESTCQATLISSSSVSCSVPGYRTTTDQIAVKSKNTNECIYSLSALNYRPRKRDFKMCG
ncbi:hypothetical protein QQ045_008873 [Rhodiola kirilowii]